VIFHNFDNAFARRLWHHHSVTS